ncbi:MAG: biotin/lipoyl-containing protein [Nitrososphaeraceae archaeon]
MKVNGNDYDIEILGEKATVNGKEVSIKLNEDMISLDGNIFYVDFVEEGEPTLMIINGVAYSVFRPEGDSVSIKNIKAPISGRVIDVLVTTGNQIKKGQVLIVIEAMKMENQIESPVNAEISEVKVNKSQSVKAGEVMITFL